VSVAAARLAEAAQRVTARLREHEVVRPEGRVDRHHWSQADRTLGLRLGALIQSAEARKEFAPLATHLRDTDRARRAAWREGREA
jgi:hypothetical protein